MNSCKPFICVITECLSTTEYHTMAPSLEEPIQVDFSGPLKATPKLVAPEPGKITATPLRLNVSIELTAAPRTLSWA